MTQLFSNNADTTLTTQLPISDLDMTVADGSGFAAPAAGQHQMVTLTDGTLYEVVTVDERIANVLYMTARAQEGTTARVWPAGTRVFAGVTKGTLEGLQPSAGSSFIESLDAGTTAIGADAVNIQAWRPTDQTYVASGEKAVVVGPSKASGAESVAIGRGSEATQSGALSIGYFAYAFGEESLALQQGHANHDGVFNMATLPAALNQSYTPGNAAAFQYNGASEMVVLSATVDLKATGTITCPVLSGGVTFYPDEVGIIVETATGVTVQPEISFGVTGDNDKLLAAVATTGLDAAKKRQRFATLLSAHGETSFTFTVTTAATATALTARAYWRGFAVQDDPA